MNALVARYSILSFSTSEKVAIQVGITDQASQRTCLDTSVFFLGHSLHLASRLVRYCTVSITQLFNTWICITYRTPRTLEKTIVIFNNGQLQQIDQEL